MNRTFTFMIVTLLASVGVAGCMSEAGPALTVRETTSDSVAAFTVEDVGKDFAYADLLIFANNKPFRYGPHADPTQGWFEVAGKDQAAAKVARGDVIRVPLTGAVDLELRDRASGTTLMQLQIMVQDHTAPAAARLQTPSMSAKGVERQTHFSWSAVTDPSGVTYQLEYWTKGPVGLNAPPNVVTGLAGTTYTPSQNDQLLPAATYSWHVRAVDGYGNIGPWSETFEFVTTV
ncbi:MAG TPA: hypothetical protein VM582_02150 [Candidatus Thermoplasmatota archaeon]|nr:hypothetical protein [Candidatus Thermoplasmatota archaeon]